MDIRIEIEERLECLFSNKGWRNTGEKNTGGMNTGNLNYGDYNSGLHNTGDYNAGDCNGGCFNTGGFNLGSYNTGDFNLCCDSSGVFCTEPQKIKIFDNDSELTLEDWRKSDTYKVLSKLRMVKWVNTEDMTSEEKEINPEHKMTGGYLRKMAYKDAFACLWQDLSFGEKETITTMPNFDKYKFKLITGIEV